MNRSLFLVVFLFQSIGILSCKYDPDLPASPELKPSIEISFAEGFKAYYNGKFSVLEISNAWPESEVTFKYALIDRDKAASISLNRDEYDGIILTPVNSLVVTSTTHLPALELLNEEESLKGFPGLDYISSPKIREFVKEGKLSELGSNEGINTEVLLSLNPEVVIAFSVNGGNKAFDTVRNAGIPVIFNGDWVENSPLAKAEWIKLFGLLFQKESESRDVFAQIENDYSSAKQMAASVKVRPTVLSGAIYKDIWYLPNGNSPEAQLLKDANLDYLWKDTSGTGSLNLNFESVFDKAKTADIWVSPSYFNSLESLVESDKRYSEFDAFKNKKVYSFVNTKGPNGGILYYEVGVARPDLVLKDLIKLGHPGLLPDYKTRFFKPLQ